MIACSEGGALAATRSASTRAVLISLAPGTTSLTIPRRASSSAPARRPVIIIWYNHERLHGELDHLSLSGHEEQYPRGGPDRGSYCRAAATFAACHSTPASLVASANAATVHGRAQPGKW